MAFLDAGKLLARKVVVLMSYPTVPVETTMLIQGVTVFIGLESTPVMHSG